MSLSAIKQIRFPVHESPFGWFEVVINRPGFPDLVQLATDTLILSEETDSINGDYSPYFEGDISFSKKFTTTQGRRALDDVTISIRDSYGYTGTVDGAPAAENFLATYSTFFDNFFNDFTAPYKAFIAWKDMATGYVEIAHEGWIDANYKPSSDPNVSSIGTAQQVWLATRTFKLTAITQTILKWIDVLQQIGPSDCQDGVPYNGYMFAPPGCGGKSNTRATAFGGGTGNWYLAVPHIHKNDPNADPILVRLAPAVWPTTPWVKTNVNQIVPTTSSNLLGMPIGAGLRGVGYNLGDTGTIDGGTTPATYYITAASLSGEVMSVELRFAGAGYSLGTTTTTATTGSGTGLHVNIDHLGTGVLFGPSGCVFITVGTLLAKCAAALGLDAFTPSTDLKSALDFFAQKADNTALNFPVDPTPIPLDEIYVSLNVFAQCHPYDGSLWDNPAGFSPDTSIPDVITGLCNFLLSDYNTRYALSGAANLKLSAMGETNGTLPASWEPISMPAEEEPSTGPRIAAISNRADKLTVQCPLGVIGDAMNVEIPIRLHRIGNTSGSNPVNDQECFMFDSSKKLEEQADECFQVAWIDASGNPALNPNCWKGLCYAYWFHASNANVVYPTAWSAFPNFDGSAGSWANSFYVVNACYKSGATPPANLCGEIKGYDYFNSRAYHAVAFAALNLPLPTIQTVTYAGLSDSTGSIQAIGSGIAGVWRDGLVAAQNWRGIELTQGLISGQTQIKWQAQGTSGAFPNITDLPYGTLDGDSTSTGTGGGNTGGGGTQPATVVTVQGTANRVTVVTTGVDNVVDIASNYAGQNTITTLGTITTGTWHGAILGLAYGGTAVNATSIAQGYVFAGPVSGSGNATFRALTSDDIKAASKSHQFFGGSATTLNATTTYYHPNGATSGSVGPDVATSFSVAEPDTAVDFFGQVDVAPGLGQAVTFIVTDGGASTALTFTITGTATTGSDINSITGDAHGFAVGTLASVSIAKTPGAASTKASFGCGRIGG